MIPRSSIRRLWTSLILGGSCLWALSGCLEKTEYITERVGFALGPRYNNWDAAEVKYGTTLSASYLLPYYLANAQDSATQRRQLINMAYPSNGNPCRAIILTSVGQDRESLDSVLRAEIPLILLETPIEGIDYTCLVTGDNVQAGKLAADFIRDTLGIAEPHVLTLEVEGSRYQERLKAFREQLGVSTIDSLVEKPTRSVGQTMMLSVLQAEGWETIDAVYTADDDLALGVLDALADQGNSSIRVVVGCGGEQELLSRIQSTDDRIIATALYPPTLLQECVEIAYRLVIQGEAPAQTEIVHPSVLIDRSNLAEYLDPESYY